MCKNIILKDYFSKEGIEQIVQLKQQKKLWLIFANTSFVPCFVVFGAAEQETLGHSSEKRGLCSTKSSSESLQNLPYF